ncbi:MAG: cupin domain-containing protein [Theionarchaea archaeon]|nr:cupin domain-containing protein [Theionarchaea archaeon]MBU7038605.1 cupin domain-containing protein [Theionarchaea archaeon]
MKNNSADTTKEDFFPDMITELPEADIPIEGLHSYLVQGEASQIIFMEFSEDVAVPEHSHEAQWGVILDGEIELTIGGETHIFSRGDTYYIPKGVLHRARIKKGFKDMTFFNQKERYTLKK